MSAPALAFPGSRALAAWWRQLAAHHPEAIWVGHLALHRVEALVDLVRIHRADRFTLFILEAIRLDHGREGSAQLAGLDERLHISRPLLRQVLRALHVEGMVRTTEGGCFALTGQG